ncbi:MAG: hypothetical protein JSV88_21055, partial [Candidatus Aminicenantes bacterium]
MKLTKKIVFVILLLCLVLCILIFLLFRLMLYDSVQEQKSRFIQQVIAGAVSVFEKETNRILTFTEDRAAWDTMYDYVSHPSREIEQNLTPSLTLKDREFSLVLAVNRNQEIVRLEGYSHINNHPLQFNLLGQKKGDTWKFLVKRFLLEESVTGIVQSEFGPMIVVSSPIFHSDLSGPQNGRLVVGRLIDRTFEKRIKKVVIWETHLLIDPVQKKWQHPSENKWLLEEEGDTLVIYYPVTDVWNRHVFTIRVDAPRHTFKILQKTTHLFLMLMMGVILLGVILYFIMDRLVVRRVKHISTVTSNIISLDDLSRQIEITRSYHDEITQLDHNINEMLKRLQSESITKEEIEHMAMLNEKLILLGRVTADITHEINNPLFAIENSIRFIKKHLSKNTNNQPLNEVVEVVEREIKRVKTIVHNIHKFAIPKMDYTKLADITTIMDAAIKVIKWSKQAKNTSIDYIKKNHSFPIYCNPEALQQVFINLILNAIEAMAGTGRLVIDVFEKEDTYRIDFIDNGPGFNDAIKAALFEPFKSTKPGKGAGLGLNISYNIIKNHKGTITLDEDYHQGAHLIVKIPKG